MNPALLALLGARVAAAGGGGDVAVVQSKEAVGLSVTLDAAPTPGNLIIISLGCRDGTLSGFTYSWAGVTVNNSRIYDRYRTSVASVAASAGMSQTLTVTAPGSGYQAVRVDEVSGVSGYASGASYGGNIDAALEPLAVGAGFNALVSCELTGDTGLTATGFTITKVGTLTRFGTSVYPAESTTTLGHAMNRLIAVTIGSYL